MLGLHGMVLPPAIPTNPSPLRYEGTWRNVGLRSSKQIGAQSPSTNLRVIERVRKGNPQ